MSSISSTSTTGASSSSSSAPTNPLGTLSKDDFLKLLVTQLQYQDPMSPMDNSQFMAQMAQFSTVEGINNLESTLGSLEGVSLIGRQVSYTADDGSSQSGIATSIAMSGSSYTVHVGSDDVDSSKIVGVTDPAYTSDPTDTTGTTDATGTTGTTDTTGTTPTGTSGG
jgi:flagellar basal-body rod modification protein FlgD